MLSVGDRDRLLPERSQLEADWLACMMQMHGSGCLPNFVWLTSTERCASKLNRKQNSRAYRLRLESPDISSTYNLNAFYSLSTIYWTERLGLRRAGR